MTCIQCEVTHGSLTWWLDQARQQRRKQGRGSSAASSTAEALAKHVHEVPLRSTHKQPRGPVAGPPQCALALGAPASPGTSKRRLHRPRLAPASPGTGLAWHRPRLAPASPGTTSPGTGLAWHRPRLAPASDRCSPQAQPHIHSSPHNMSLGTQRFRPRALSHLMGALTPNASTSGTHKTHHPHERTCPHLLQGRQVEHVAWEGAAASCRCRRLRAYLCLSLNALRGLH